MHCISSNVFNVTSPQIEPTQTPIEKLNSILQGVCIGETLCLDQLCAEWQTSKPLLNKTILLNGHLTLTTLFIVRCLLIGGAKVDLAAIGELNIQNSVKELLHKNQFSFYQRPLELPHHLYDVLIDCNAGLLGIVKPNFGTVELTKTSKYHKCDVSQPVISVDSSPLKCIETFLGTGNGFWRAIEKIFEQADKQLQLRMCDQRYLSFKTDGNEIVTLKNLSRVGFKPSDHRFAVIGYGKVGKGICHELLRNGIPADHILVIETSDTAASQAREQKFDVIQLNPHDLIEIKKKLNQCSFIVTSTGVKGCMSYYFTQEAFDDTVNFINMGTLDEWGANFCRVLNQKRPINFSLEFPTSMIYLEATFKALCLSANFLISNYPLCGFQAVPQELNNSIIHNWEQNYKMKCPF